MTGMSVQAQPLHEQVYNNTQQINANKYAVQYLQKKDKVLRQDIDKMYSDVSTIKNESRKGTATALAVANIEYPQYNKDKKVSIAVATGTYKGNTAIAYGLAYRPNEDIIFSIKGTDDTIGGAVGMSL